MIRFQALRFHLHARGTVFFPPFKAGNVFRGALGHVLQESVFRPKSSVGFASGLRDLPRPFVLRASHLDGKRVEAGEKFYTDLNLFDLESAALQHIKDAFARFAEAGLGAERARVDLDSVAPLGEPGSVSLESESGPIDRITVQFLTPTEIKSADRIIEQPEFGALAARIRDRVSNLCRLYGGGVPPLDFRAFGERASMVRMQRSDVKVVRVTRRSSRTQQVHNIGGVIGEAEYEGDLTAFLPWLRAAYWTGVGRHTIWGNGWVQVSKGGLLFQRDACLDVNQAT